MDFGPVSSATSNTPGDFVWGCFLFVAASIVIVLGWLSSARRSRAFRAATRKYGWNWMGENFPEYLPVRDLLGGTDRPISVSNVFTGHKNGSEFTVLDCVLGQGRNKTRLSIVAVRSQSNPFGAERFDAGLQVDRAGEWIAIRRAAHGVGVHSPGYFQLSAAETLALIESIS